MTGTSLVNPLQSLIKAAAGKPATTGETRRYHERVGASGSHLVICDVSGSMSRMADRGRRIDRLREALALGLRPEHLIIGFSSSASIVESPAHLPEPDGGTALDQAINLAAGHAPAVTLVISDGQPDDADAALAAAERLSGVINTLYVGPDGDREAILFMRRLARLGCGEAQTNQWSAAVPLESSIRRLMLPR